MPARRRCPSVLAKCRRPLPYPRSPSSQNTTLPTHLCTTRAFFTFSHQYHRDITPSASGTSIPTPLSSENITVAPKSGDVKHISSFQTGFSLYAKRPPRPFPKPWINPPTSSFSEPLSLHSTSLSRRSLHPHQHQLYHPSISSSPSENLAAEASASTARFLRGYTNGDDAIVIHNKYLAVADGVGSWNTKDRGFPALWSRLLVHYFSIGCERFFNRSHKKKHPNSHTSSSSDHTTIEEEENEDVDIQVILNEAFNAVVKATAILNPPSTPPKPEEGKFGLVTGPTSRTQRFHGTTTFTGCLLYGRKLRVVSIGDSHCLVLRPSTITSQDTGKDPGFLLRTTEQWHYFDCPRQLGTDSPDTPLGNAVVSTIDVQNGDIVILATDGMLDNLWEEEVISIILHTLTRSSGGYNDESFEKMEIEEIMRKKGKKRVEEGVNVAFREYLSKTDGIEKGEEGEVMTSIAAELVKAAKVVATDGEAESPWMERAIGEGISAEGGKLDDISVVVGRITGL